MSGGDHVPADAHELLSPEAIEHWLTSGERVGDDMPPELEAMRLFPDALDQTE